MHSTGEQCCTNKQKLDVSLLANNNIVSKIPIEFER